MKTIHCVYCTLVKRLPKFKCLVLTVHSKFFSLYFALFFSSESRFSASTPLPILQHCPQYTFVCPACYRITPWSFFLIISPGAEFLDVIGPKVLRVFLLALHSHLYTTEVYSPPEPKWIETCLYTETSSLRTLKIFKRPLCCT
jgi:hypothetical protein